jgi:putative ATP-grasp target RiPP
VIAAIDDPLASASGQFPLAAPAGTPPATDVPSPVGLRPWGLRTLTVTGRRPMDGLPTAPRYDHDQQVAVGPSGTPLITMGPPTANTTSSTDGEDPPSSEDWYNDFHPDEPLQV